MKLLLGNAFMLIVSAAWAAFCVYTDAGWLQVVSGVTLGFWTVLTLEAAERL